MQKKGGSKLVNRVIQRIWDKDYFDAHVKNSMVARKHWFDMEEVAPLLALMWRLSIVIYAKYDGKLYSTTIAYYRRIDNKVSTETFFHQIVCPPKDVVIVYNDGISHYNYCKRVSGAPQSFIEHIGGDSSTLQEPSRADDSKQPHNKATHSVSQIGVKSQLKSPTNVTSQSKYDVGIQPDSSASNRYTHDLLSTPTKKKKTDIVLHPYPVSSPLKQKLIYEKERDHSEFFISECVDDSNSKQYVTWKNEKEYQVQITAGDFDKLVQVILTPNCTVSPFKLEWKSHESQFEASDTILGYLRKLGMYKSHYDLRFKNNHVKSKYFIKDLNKVIGGNCNHDKNEIRMCKTVHRKSRALTALCIYKDRECGHRKGIFGKCQSTAYIGSHEGCILEHVIGKIMSIPLMFEVTGICYHEKHVNVSRLQGE